MGEGRRVTLTVGSVLKTPLNFHCRGHSWNPGLGTNIPLCCEVQPKLFFFFFLMEELGFLDSLARTSVFLYRHHLGIVCNGLCECSLGAIFIYWFSQFSQSIVNDRMQTIFHTPFLTQVFLLYPHENYQKKKNKITKETHTFFFSEYRFKKISTNTSNCEPALWKKVL